MLRKSSDIELRIEGYEYIFSDFDSRPYSQKLISEDLLDEMNRTILDKKNRSVNLKFIISKDKRNTKKENVIKKRLKEYFQEKLKEIQKEKKKILRGGIFFVLFGIFFMVVATFFLVRESGNYLIIFLAVLSEPAGWFLFWEGLNLIIFDVKKKMPSLAFYKKMSKATIYFTDFR